MAICCIIRVGSQETKSSFTVILVSLINYTDLRANEWGKLAKQHLPNRGKVSLSLQHIGEVGEIGLEPVLFRVLLSRKPKVVDHRVYVVLELRDFPLGFHLNRSREIALRNGCRDIGNRPNL